jgi:hypothetical protein
LQHDVIIEILLFMKRHNEDRGAVFISAGELWTRLDALTMALLGVGAAEFAAGWGEGRFDRAPMASYLAMLLPFATPPAHG